IARHLARFYQAHGEYAHTAMANVLRNWGAAGISGVTRDSRAADVGAEYEWPHALRSRKTTFESIRAEVRDRERAAAGQATEGDASEDSQAQRYDRAASLHDQLTQIYLAVQQSRDFDSEGARVSLLREIDDYRTRLRRLRVSHREQSRTARELAREGRAPDQLDHMMQEARADAEIARASRAPKRERAGVQPLGDPGGGAHLRTAVRLDARLVSRRSRAPSRLRDRGGSALGVAGQRPGRNAQPHARARSGLADRDLFAL